MANPNGWFISVKKATVSRPASRPISTIAVANSFASSNVFMKAPAPNLTSKTIASAPAAIFLLIIEEAIKGIDSTVPVTSRRAYKYLSAGAKFPVWPIIANLISLTCWINWSISISIFIPEIDSSLSSVPPVWPKPRPLIFATGTPIDATRGPKIKDVLSPTPPVECLSTLTPSIADKSTTSPLLTIAWVNAKRSAFVISLKTIAINKADIW